VLNDKDEDNVDEKAKKARRNGARWSTMADDSMVKLTDDDLSGLTRGR
jgi:hypothetical protein